MSFNRSPALPPASGTVTTVSVTTANGVSGTVATASTTPAISLALGDITPTNVNVAENGVVAIASQGSAFSSVLSAPGGLAEDINLTLPQTFGAMGQVLQDQDGAGLLSWRDAGVSAATVANLISALNGKQVADLIGTSNVTLSGIQTLDGAPTSSAGIVLLAGQTDPTENGMWLVNDFSAWSRPTGWDNPMSVVPGSLVSISSNAGGVSYSNTLWFGEGDGSSTASYQRVPVALSTNTGWGSITNVTPDKAYDADATTVDELADVLGTLIVQLIAQGVLKT